jgi:hypothetical protein
MAAAQCEAGPQEASRRQAVWRAGSRTGARARSFPARTRTLDRGSIC